MQLKAPFPIWHTLREPITSVTWVPVDNTL